jgi:hypothetical protein
MQQCTVSVELIFVWQEDLQIPDEMTEDEADEDDASESDNPLFADGGAAKAVTIAHRPAVFGENCMWLLVCVIGSLASILSEQFRH